MHWMSCLFKCSVVTLDTFPWVTEASCKLMLQKCTGRVQQVSCEAAVFGMRFPVVPLRGGPSISCDTRAYCQLLPFSSFERLHPDYESTRTKCAVALKAVALTTLPPSMTLRLESIPHPGTHSIYMAPPASPSQT
jgi:hypothetical protein